MRRVQAAVPVALLALATVFSVPSYALITHWNMVGVSFTDGGVATGWFEWDAEAEAFSEVSNWSISVSGGNEGLFPPKTYDPSNSHSYGDLSWGDEKTIFFIFDEEVRQLRITPLEKLTSAGGSTDIDLNTDLHGGSVECLNCDPARLIAGGSLQADTAPSCAYRVGNVNTGDGRDPVDVLYLDGLVGDACRELDHSSGIEAVIFLDAPPSRSQANYGLWIYDGFAKESDVSFVVLQNGKGTIFLGTAPRCFPTNNTETPGSCPCPVTFPTGRTSKDLGAGKAATLCLNKKPGYPRAPAGYPTTLPVGDYTIMALVQDDNSINSPFNNISIANTICVHSL